VHEDVLSNLLIRVDQRDEQNSVGPVSGQYKDVMGDLDRAVEAAADSFASSAFSIFNQPAKLTGMLELDQAVAQILATIPKPVAESISLSQAHRRILASPVEAPIDLPPFDNSSMDGYAVRSVDVAGATGHQPVELRVVNRIAAGDNPGRNLTPGCAIRLFTGSPLPGSSDAVVMQEDTRVNAGQPETVSILEPARAGENVRYRGEDIKRGGQVSSAGDFLGPNRIALLAALGVESVSVGRQPSVGLLATGTELKSAGALLEAGQIYESNRSMLSPLVSMAGGLPKIFPIVSDEAGATRSALEAALANNDITVTSGGVSVGELDFVKSAFESLGGTLQFWKVSIKPGKPFVFGKLRDKFLFGLPGNPVSAFVTFLLLVRPALLRWQGASDVSLPSHPGILAESVANPGGRRHFVRVTVDGNGKVRSTGTQSSHVLSSLAAANGLLDVAPHTTLPAGSVVSVLRWDLT
jgi:molybdopterin molybdotransferase